MKIAFVDLKRQYEAHKEELSQAIESVILEGNFILGPSVKKFEKSFADYIGCKYAVGVSSGSSALRLSVSVLNIGADDEVITVPNTYIATAFAITQNRGQVVLADVDEQTQLMNIEAVQSVITEKTKAIIPVHLGGQMVDMERLSSLAESHGLDIIEDACQSHGASQKGIKAGAIGRLACFSFYPGKNLGAYGDGGAITTNDEELYQQLLILRNHGTDGKYHHKLKGSNERLDSIQAAVLSVKLKYLDKWNERRNMIAVRYLKELTGVGDLILPQVSEPNYSVYHLFVLRTQKRDDLFKHLNENGIQTIIHYPIPIHLQEAYSELSYQKGSFPIAEMLANEILSLPIHPDMTEEDVDLVIEEINNFFN